MLKHYRHGHRLVKPALHLLRALDGRNASPVTKEQRSVIGIILDLKDPFGVVYPNGKVSHLGRIGSQET